MPFVLLALLPLAQLQAAPAPGFVWEGDPEAQVLLGSWAQGALASTESFGAWPPGAWRLHIHQDDAAFEMATGAPPGRFACWVGPVLHLRPWTRLQRRDLGALLRHEFTHRRMAGQGLRRWREEALCLWAEGHTRPPVPWPTDPDEALQDRLDSVLQGGTTVSQSWAYAWLRAWLEQRPLPGFPAQPRKGQDGWRAELPMKSVVVAWPPERLPRTLEINGQAYAWQRSAQFHFEGGVTFGAGSPIPRLDGTVDLRGEAGGWRLLWTTTPETWIAAATEGELGSEAPYEAKRALAAVLKVWLHGHPEGNHPDGTLCPLTHCAVVRGPATPSGEAAAAGAPVLDLPPDRALFTGSKGGVSLSPREIWGAGSNLAGSASVIPGDPWATWSREFTAAQVRSLKAAVHPGLKPGQRGLRLGVSGPYAVEDLRLAAGRRFGWTAWPSNACEVRVHADGSLSLTGHGWGHNVGLCLATAVYRARQGEKAERILEEAFGADPGEFLLHPDGEPADP